MYLRSSKFFLMAWLGFGLLALGIEASAQSGLIRSHSVPWIQNFTRSDYGGAYQIWDIEQDSAGRMYFATLDALIEYDGLHWTRHELLPKSNLRCLSLHAGRLYSGGFGTFGYWVRNASNALAYVPLLDQSTQGETANDEIWRMHSLDGKLYAQSYYRIFVVDGEQVNQIQAPGRFQFSFVVGQRLFVQDKEYGLYELRNGRLELLVRADQLAGQEIWGITELDKLGIILATFQGQLYQYHQGQLTPWRTAADAFLQGNNIFSVQRLDAHSMAIGTILGGCVVIDNQGRAVQQIDKTKGLKNNTVLSMHFDMQRNLWLGLDNGIAFLNTNSPYTYEPDVLGRIGAVYCALRHQNKVYLGTNQGLLEADYQQMHQALQPTDFRLVPGTQGQVWSLTEHQGRVWCGHDKGVFLIDTQAQRISTANGIWQFRPWPHDPDVLLAGTYQGLVVFRRQTDGQWREHAQPKGFEESARFFEIDAYDNIWVAHPVKGLYRIRLNAQLDRVSEREFYGRKTKIGVETGNYVMRFENEVVFSTPNGFFSYEVLQNNFVHHTKLNQLFGADRTVHRMLGRGATTWFSNDHTVGYLERKGNGYQLHEEAFRRTHNNFIPNFSNISLIDDSTLSLASYDGLTLLHPWQQMANARLFAPHISQLRAIGQRDTLLLPLDGNKVEVPYANRLLLLEWASANYGRSASKTFYQIDGGPWVETNSQLLWLPSLEAGAHTVQLRQHFGARTSVEMPPFAFRVLAPWYAQWWALGLWLLLGLLLVVGLWHAYQWHLQSEKKRLQHQQEEALRLQQEHYENEALKNQQKIMLLEKEQLEAEVSYKSKELANMVINNIDKNEVLGRIKAELTRIQDESSQKLPRKYYQQLIAYIDQNYSQESDWNVFEMNFNEAYEGFFKKLKARHPLLTPHDMRLCAYLRLNLSTKEIAPLLGISARSVEVSRYRLRKKLDLGHTDNLIDYLLKV